MKKIVQIGIAVKDLEKAMEKYWNVFGIGPWDIYTFSPPSLESTPYTKKPNYSFKIALAHVGDIQLEIIQPLGGPTIHKDFLEKKGEGIQHIKEYVPKAKLPETIKNFEKMGIKVVQGGKFADDEHYYLDTEEMLGFVYELGNSADVGPPEARYPSETT